MDIKPLCVIFSNLIVFVIYTVNKVAYRKHHFTTSSVTRNKGEVEKTCHCKNYSVQTFWVVILLSVHWSTFYISLHVVMMVEGFTLMPYPLFTLHTLA